MSDVAKKAGISRKYVSGILNDNASVWVSQKTRERVKKIARELNYRPNHFARSLKTGKTYSIGLMGSLSIVDVSAYCFAKTTWGVETELAEARSAYSLIMFGANFQDSEEKSRELIERRMVDGLIFMILSPDLEKFNRTLVPLLRRINTPFVVVHSTSAELPYHNVGLDSRRAGYLAAEHFIRRGFESSGFFLRDDRNPQIMEMLEGFKKAWTAGGRAWSDLQIIRPQPSQDQELHDGAYNAVAVPGPLPRALFFPEDASAYAAIDAYAARGVRVPQDLAVIGCDDEIIPYVKMRLTSVHHPFAEKGREAVKMLTGILDGKDRGKVRQVILKPHLVVRETCGSTN
jgi:LacI family transcriptional regulator